MEVIVSPSALRHFARRLTDHAHHVQDVGSALAQGMQDLNTTWRDDRYRRFEGDLTATLSELERFVRAARVYVAYLERKAVKADEFLDR